MDEISILKNKIKLIISKYHDQEYIKEFELLLEQLNKLESNEVSIPQKNVFSRIFSSLKTAFFKPAKVEFDQNKYAEIREKVIKLYRDKILKRKNPIIVNAGYNGGDAYFANKNEADLTKQLLTEIENYQIARTRMKEGEDKKIEIYPWVVEEQDLTSFADKEYYRVSEIFLTSDKTEEQAFEEVTINLSLKNQLIKEKYMQSEIAPYYGSPQFIYERSQYILECMRKIIADESIKPENKATTNQFIDEANSLVKEIEECTNYLSTQRDNEKYNKIRANFEKLLEFENIILKDIEQIWNEYLTDPKDYEEGKKFAFLVHAHTGRIAKDNERTKCCCTLVTEKCMPIPYGDIGIICGFNAANIGTMCTEDAGSWLTSQEEFFDRRLPKEWQFAEIAGDNKHRVFYEYPKLSKLILPTTMEKEMLKNNLKEAEKFKNKSYKAYTEIFMVKGVNGENIPVQGRFYTSKKSKEKLKIVDSNYPLIMLDPSSGTLISFPDNNSKDQEIMEK